MSRTEEYILVMVTCPTKSADRIARVVLTKRAAARVNIISGMKSHYWWKGKIETSSERLLLIKTRRSLFTSLEKLVRSVHPNDVPEIIAIPLVEGSSRYLNWIKRETQLARR